MKPFKAETPMEDVPRTAAEYRRQKGPVPPAAIFLALGLALAVGLFFGLPAIQSMIDQF